MPPPTLDALPTALLLKIISMTNRFRSPFDFSPNRTLPRLARVSKTLHSVTVQILYSDVYIYSSENHLILWKIRAFFRTISKDVHLASLVRSIHFASKYYAKGETKTLANAIQVCPHLEGVEVSGWNGYELDELKDAMKSRKGMKRIELCRRGMTDIECDYFCHLEEFVNMLQGWPLLERVVIQNDTIGGAEFADTDDENDSESSASDHPPPGEEELDEETRAARKALRQEYFASVKALPRLSVTPNACPALAHFDFRCGTLESRHIIALSLIAPNIAYIHIRGGSCGFNDSESLATALRNWSNSLQALKMDFYYSEKDDGRKKKDWVLDIGDVLSEMTVLKYVRLSSSYMQPEAFQTGWEALERLKYHVWDHELGRFAKVFKSAGALPNLKRLYIRRRTREGESHRKAFPPTVWKDIQKICKKRGVELEATDDFCDTEDAEMGGSINGPRYEMDDPYMYEYEADEEEDGDEEDWDEEDGDEDEDEGEEDEDAGEDSLEEEEENKRKVAFDLNLNSLQSAALPADRKPVARHSKGPFLQL